MATPLRGWHRSSGLRELPGSRNKPSLMKPSPRLSSFWQLDIDLLNRDRLQRRQLCTL
jgi:hypothetical protein